MHSVEKILFLPLLSGSERKFLRPALNYCPNADWRYAEQFLKASIAWRTHNDLPAQEGPILVLESIGSSLPGAG